jgi:hypothetical protein
MAWFIQYASFSSLDQQNDGVISPEAHDRFSF